MARGEIEGIIEAPAVDRIAQQLLGGEPEPLADGLGQLRVGVVEREAEIEEP